MARTAVAAASIDMMFSAFWVIGASTPGAIVTHLAPYIGTDEQVQLGFVLGIVMLQIIFYGSVADALGGASFNPLANLANFLASVGDETFTSLMFKIPAQLLGCMLGAVLTWYLVPEQLKYTLTGPVPTSSYSLWTAIAVEFSLTLLLNLVVMWALFAGPKNQAVQLPVIITATLTAIAIGAPYTGPSMNPAFAFAWAWKHGRCASWDHFHIYWLAPTVGAVGAAVLYVVLFGQRQQISEAEKEKSE